jgi:hypothetical protein
LLILMIGVTNLSNHLNRHHQAGRGSGLAAARDVPRRVQFSPGGAHPIGCGVWEDPDEIERFVEARIARQDRLRGEKPLQLWAVICEGALRQQIGGQTVLRSQLTHLMKMTDLPNVKVQVLPYVSGAHAGMEGAFNIVSFAELGAVDVVYLDTPSSSLCLASEKDAARHTAIFDRVARLSLAQADSRSLIRRIIEEP